MKKVIVKGIWKEIDQFLSATFWHFTFPKLWPNCSSAYDTYITTTKDFSQANDFSCPKQSFFLTSGMGQICNICIWGRNSQMTALLQTTPCSDAKQENYNRLNEGQVLYMSA